MADERLRIRIEADAKRAEKDLKNLAKLSEELTDDQKTILVQAKTAAAEKNLKSLERQLGKVDDPVDMKVLTKGVEQARDELEQLNKLADKADAQEVDIDTSKSVENIDDLGNSADKSRSVLANMVGNSAQDLSALGGIAGSAGVAIGQIGEYAADAAAGGSSFGAILKNFASVAGPIAALSVGIGLATKAWGDYQATQKRVREENDAALARIREQFGAIEELQKTLTGGAGFSIAETLLGDADPDELSKMAEGLVAFGSDIETLLAQLDAGDGSIEGLVTQFAKMSPALNAARTEFGLTDAEIARVVTSTDNANTAAQHLIEGNTELAKALARDEGFKEFVGNVELIEDAFDEIDLEGQASKAINEMVAGLSGPKLQRAVLRLKELYPNESDLQILRRLNTELQDQASETAKASKQAELWRQRQDRLNDEFQQGREGAAAYSEAVGSIDFGAAALEGATTAFGEFTDQQFAAGNLIQDQADAWDKLSESVKEHGFSLDTATEKGAAQQDALEDLAGVIDTQLSQAYVDAAGDGAKFKTSAEGIANSLRDRLRKELGLSDEQIEEVITQLGLMPTQVETRYALAGVEEAKIQLGLLDTAIENLPDNVQTTVTQQILAGDYVGALNTIQDYYNRHPVTGWVELRVRKRGGSGEGGDAGFGPAAAALPPPVEGPAPGALAPVPVGVPTAAGSVTIPAGTITLDVAISSALARRQMRSITRELERMAGLTRTVHGAHSRYLWRNGRYLETNAV